MRRILKWTVPVDDEEHEIGGGPVVHVAAQTSALEVQIWTDEGESALVRTVQVVGTGHPIPERATILGSTLAGPYVWHVIAPAGGGSCVEVHLVEGVIDADKEAGR